ncbi:hypothetical protein TRFO_24131 [Tritrichomonas foetus]|uniref:Uncharacterized protein n=1 Tax=Tritrichomonas foetus TaxID=1144522 RepID=A0A1J4K8U4_9EUKA|nr:hypothetical protein TRFO_24131 [Tritrichomonas foetus]|eukprot:OHT07635.1 hypothetical protein TRFO_24131 [Tritrichomonas foetus]
MNDSPRSIGSVYETSISQLSQLQFLLINITNDTLSETFDFIQRYFADSSEKCRQLAHQLLIPIKFRSKSYSLVIKLILLIIENSSINYSLFELPKSISMVISHEISTDNIIPYQNSIQAFLYQCYTNGIFEIGDVIEIIKECFDHFSLFNESICSLFCWFAPEIEEEDHDLFNQCLEAFQMHIQCTQFKSVYRSILDNFDTLKENNWLTFKQNRETIESNDPVYQAIRNDDIEALKQLSCNENFNLNKHYEMSPFEPSWIMRFNPTGIQIAAYFGSLKCFKFFLLNNADFHISTGSMPLPYFATAGGNPEIIHLTEQLDCDFNDSLHCSVVFHQYDIFEWLIDIKQLSIHEKDTNEDSILHLAILSDNLCVLSYFQEINESIDEVDEYGMTLLHYAAKYGNFAVLNFLINENPSLINKKDLHQMTPLHYSVKHRHYETTKLLLDQNETLVNAKNSNGWTPLHFAVDTNNPEITKMLLNNPKIDRHARNNARITPSLLASKLQFENIINLFLSCSVRPKTTPSMYRRPLTGATNGQRPFTVSSPEKRRPATSMNATRCSAPLPATVNSIIPSTTEISSTITSNSNQPQTFSQNQQSSQRSAQHSNQRIRHQFLQHRREKPKLRLPGQSQQNGRRTATTSNGVRNRPTTITTSRVIKTGHVNFID